MKSPFTKNTLLKNAQANPASNFLREYFFRHPRRNSIFFLPPFGVLIFFATAQQPTTDKHLDRTTQETNQQQLDADEEARTGNSGFKKLTVQWLNEHSTSHQHLWWLDSFVLRNRQLLKPAKRYRPAVF